MLTSYLTCKLYAMSHVILLLTELITLGKSTAFNCFWNIETYIKKQKELDTVWKTFEY